MLTLTGSFCVQFWDNMTNTTLLQQVADFIIRDPIKRRVQFFDMTIKFHDGDKLLMRKPS